MPYPPLSGLVCVAAGVSNIVLEVQGVPHASGGTRHKRKELVQECCLAGPHALTTDITGD